MPLAKVSVATGSTPTVVAQAKARKSLAIQNQGTDNVYIAWDPAGSSVTVDSGANPGWKLVPGAGIILVADARYPVGQYSNAVHAVHGSGSAQSLAVLEE